MNCFGNLLFILLMSWKMNINFPEDRVAMQLVILLILFFAFVVEKIKHSYLILLFFPLSFLFHLSLSTSVFSNDNRMSSSFYEKVRKRVNSSMLIGLYPMQELTWSYHEKHNPKSHFKVATNWERGYDDNYDILIMKENRSKVSDYLEKYNEIAYEPTSGYHAFLRKEKLNKCLVDKKIMQPFKTDKDTSLIFNKVEKPIKKESSFIFSMSGSVKIDSVFDNVEFRLESINQKGEIFQTNKVPLRWYYGSKKLNIDFSFNLILKNIPPNTNKINCYIWNPQRRILIFRNVKLNIYKIIK